MEGIKVESRLRVYFEFIGSLFREIGGGAEGRKVGDLWIILLFIIYLFFVYVFRSIVR